jgi:ADP-ribosylglycohydrolase
MIAKYAQQTSGVTCWQALLANANIGGENVHRGAVLGAILGALAGDDTLPTEMTDGLYDKGSIHREIDAFVESITRKSSNVNNEL